MGFYINPPDMTKEAWLAAHGERLTGPPSRHIDNGKVVVSHVDNGPFTAAAVAYSMRDLEEFQRPDDRRPKQWWHVPIAKVKELLPHCPI